MKAGQSPDRSSRYSPKQFSAVTAVRGIAASGAEFERQAVVPTGVESRRDDREESRKHSTSHEHLASPSDRTVLLCSFRPDPGEREPSDGSVDVARPRCLPPRHAGGKRIYVDPFLNGNPKCPGGGADAGARRRDRAHPRPRRPRRRHGRPARSTACTVVAHGRARGLAPTNGVEDALVGRTRAAPSRSTASRSRSRTPSTRAPRRTARTRASRPGSSSARDGTSLYFAGDTCVFGDMQLIGRIYEPSRGAADRRPLHDGPGGGRASRSSCSATTLCAVPLGDVPAPDRDARRSAGLTR